MTQLSAFQFQQGPESPRGLVKTGFLGPGLLSNLGGSVQSKNVGPLVEKLNQSQDPSKCEAQQDCISHTRKKRPLKDPSPKFLIQEVLSGG